MAEASSGTAERDALGLSTSTAMAASGAEPQPQAVARVDGGGEDEDDLGIDSGSEEEAAEEDEPVGVQLGPSRGGPSYTCQAASRVTAAAGQPVQVGETHPDYVRALAWVGPEALWTGCWDNTVRLFDVQ